MIVFVVALLVAQDPAAAPLVVDGAGDGEALVTNASPRAPCPDVVALGEELAYRHTHAVLEAYAGQGRLERAATAVGAGALSAALIAASIAYVAVGNVDIQLSKIDAEDTKLAGYVAGGAAVIPAAVMVSQLVLTSDEEQRLDAFEVPAPTSADRRDRVHEAQRSLRAASPSWGPIVGGSVLIGGAFASAGIGGYFILLPHLPNPRGIVTHGTGAELIGAGVAALGIGLVLIATSGTTAPGQLELLTEEPASSSSSSAALR